MSAILWAGVIGILIAVVTVGAGGHLRRRKARGVISGMITEADTRPAPEPCPWCTHPECGAGPAACTCREHRRFCEGIPWCGSWWPGNPVPIEWERSRR